MTFPKIAIYVGVLVIVGLSLYLPEVEKAAAPPEAAPQLIEFTSKTCPACTQMKPIVEQIKKEFASRIKFVEIDTDDPKNEPMEKQLEVDLLPAFRVLDATNNVVSGVDGAVPIDTLRQMLNHASGGQ